MLGVVLLPAFTRLGHERQDLLSRWNAWVQRLDLGLYSRPKEFFFGNGFRTYVNSKGKIPSTRKILPRGGWNPQHYIKQDSEPNTLPVRYSGPLGLDLKLHLLVCSSVTTRSQFVANRIMVTSSFFKKIYVGRVAVGI